VPLDQHQLRAMVISCSLRQAASRTAVFSRFPVGSVTGSARISGVRVSIHAAKLLALGSQKIEDFRPSIWSWPPRHEPVHHPKKSNQHCGETLFVDFFPIRVEMATCVNNRATVRKSGAAQRRTSTQDVLRNLNGFLRTVRNALAKSFAP